MNSGDCSFSLLVPQFYLHLHQSVLPHYDIPRLSTYHSGEVSSQLLPQDTCLHESPDKVIMQTCFTHSFHYKAWCLHFNKRPELAWSVFVHMHQVPKAKCETQVEETETEKEESLDEAIHHLAHCLNIQLDLCWQPDCDSCSMCHCSGVCMQKPSTRTALSHFSWVFVRHHVLLWPGAVVTSLHSTVLPAALYHWPQCVKHDIYTVIY